MGRITITTFVSLDGIAQGPGGPEEDRSGGFDRGGWSVPFGDEDFGTFVTGVFEHASAFLLGRRTYDIFAGYWPEHDDETDPIPNKLNRLPKYVASSTLTAPTWQGTTVLAPDDLAGRVARLRAETDDELQVHGSLGLAQWLLANALVDEHHVLTFPVVVGAGRRLFADGAPATAMQLSNLSSTAAGVVIASYRPTGPAQFGSY
ncbi:dihydrofolate reductase family protein [Angustibacter sp. McL0619]|uniref:dihydrofolate reductase family protein n=1 Tax=Angustibacter sp. McL0619 TaxID=3415676 RepID=UPI003CEEDF5A